MIIKNIKLKNFRNYENLDFVLNNRLNIIIGNNAQGKTNILESIYFLSLTKSFFAVNDKVVIKKNCLYARIDGVITSNNGCNNLSILVNNYGKYLKIGNKEIKKSSDYLGYLKVILFSPDNIRLLKEGPSIRRRFLNIEISQLSKRYILILNQFNDLLKQRNEYLKNIRNSLMDKDYMLILNQKFAELAYQIYNFRNDFIVEINKRIKDIYKSIINIDNIEIKYITDVKLNDKEIMINEIKDRLDKNYDKEILYGNTLIGPQRDDFSILLNGNDISSYGSQGQMRIAILSVKLSEIDIIFNKFGEYPVILLDDIFSELDVDKRNKLIKYLNCDRQVIITTTDIENINEELVNNAKLFKIDNGKVIETREGMRDINEQ
ncbi:MAG: DNA replication/repair protein RecF [Bacilli bacterium]|nr:DNA replication/repair protein RecF [Bacilli bacterium]